MKRLILSLILCIPFIVNAQSKLQHSRAYIGAILHDSKLGGSLILSYGINKYIGVGAGVDLTSYTNKGYSSSNTKSKFFAPFYADLRFKYPISSVEPFIFGQFGKPGYTEHLTTFTDITGRPTYQLYQSGKYFYGVGLGASSKKGKVGVFVSATYRIYNFKYSPDNVEVNGRPLPDPENKEVVVVSAGLVF